LKEDNKNLRLNTNLDKKMTKSIKCQTDKYLMTKTINYKDIDVSPDKFKHTNHSSLNKINSVSSLGTNIITNNHSILKKEKSNKNDSIVEFRNEIFTILNEFKQFPEKIKHDLKNEIINEVTNMSKN